MKTLEPGSYINGTLRLQDLIPKFLDIIRECRGAVPRELLPNRAALRNENHRWWGSTDAFHNVNLLLDHIRNNVTPEGHYFGTHPGDGSDFGVWEIELEQVP